MKLELNSDLSSEVIRKLGRGFGNQDSIIRIIGHVDALDCPRISILPLHVEYH